MSANTFKRLNVSDTFIVPYTANKSWNISSSSFADKNIVINIGINYSGSIFDPTTEFFTNNQYDRLVYNLVNNTYYPDFLPKTLNTESRLIDYTSLNLIISSSDISTSSYYNGHVNFGNIDTIRYFPTGFNDIVYVLNIPKSLASDKVLPTTFELTFNSGSTYTGSIYDDGNYNLIL